MSPAPRLPVRALAGGVALVLAANAVALGGVLYNRSGTPDAVVTMSGRELPPVRAGGPNEDNSGISLYLDWRPMPSPDPYDDVATFTDPERLAAIGFDVSVAPDAPDARRHYHRQLARDAYLVLEFDGQQHARAVSLATTSYERSRRELAARPDDKELRQRTQYLQDEVRRETLERSRLFAVDAGPDAGALREKYPKNHLIVRGQIHIDVCNYKGPPKVCGRAFMAGNRIHLPTAMTAPFRDQVLGRHRPDRTGNYAIELAIGRRHEPWVVSARELATK